tara:strand:+ start:1470 stop:1979 length:510 start_codon:yes stop_codon:yes gene_type:complete
MLKKLNYHIITLFIFGSFIKKYRGTWASLFTTLLLFLIFHILEIEKTLVLIIILFVSFYSIFAIKTSLKEFSGDDPQEIVIDEFIGQSIPICLYELFHNEKINTLEETLQIYFWFFLLFRIFDGLKPFPIDYIDRKYKNTFGILFDDILAGVYVTLSSILFILWKTYLF